jgi:hypothetical protein
MITNFLVEIKKINAEERCSSCLLQATVVQIIIHTSSPSKTAFNRRKTLTPPGTLLALLSHSISDDSPDKPGGISIMSRRIITLFTLACFVWVQYGCTSVYQTPREKLAENPDDWITKIVKTDGREIYFIERGGSYGHYQSKGKYFNKPVIAGYVAENYNYIEVPVAEIQTAYIETMNRSSTCTLGIVALVTVIAMAAALVPRHNGQF